MSDSLIVGLISALVSLLGIFASQRDIMTKMEKNQAILEERIKELTKRVDSHNNYAALFNENIPVLKEQFKNLDHRFEELERRQET